MKVQNLYDLLESNLDNCIDYVPEKMSKLKRVKLPIPEEYGGGVATGLGYEAAVKNLIERIKKQIQSNSEGPLFSECWNSWIELKSGQNKSACTIASYKRNAKNHLLPFFGNMCIDKITADNIQQYYNSIMHLSKSVSNQSKAILQAIFERADRLGQISRNPMHYKYERSQKTGEKIVLQDKQLIDIISQLNLLTGNDYLYTCFLCFTALRRGEILGLRWSDIDFENEEIHVKNNVTYPDGANDPVVTVPKDNSFGVVHLNKLLSKNILKHKSNGYIISYSSNESNRPITKSMFTKMWRRINKTIDLKGATSHSFRASYATMMNAHCEHIDPKALQGALRHKTPDLAIKIYAKENKDKTRNAEIEYDEYLCSAISHNME